MATSLCRGTITVKNPCSVCFPNLTWLPFWLTEPNPAERNLLSTSRKVSRLGGTDFDLNLHGLPRNSVPRLLEVQLQRLP